MSGPIDPSTIVPGQTVQLSPSPAASRPRSRWRRSISRPRPTSSSSSPRRPWRPATTWCSSPAMRAGGQPVLAGPAGVPLGEDAQHPDGADESFVFQVDGIDGVAGATASDDTRGDGPQPGRCHRRTASCRSPGPSASTRLQPGPVADPTTSTRNPANQVDLYHFQISGPGQYAVLAEVFAGRIGSPLDPGISLFELDPEHRQPRLPRRQQQHARPHPGHRRVGSPVHRLGAHRRPDGRRLLPRRGRRLEHALAARGPDARQPRDLRSQPAGQRQDRLEHGPLPPQPDGPAGPGSAEVVASSPSPGQVLGPGPHADHRAVLGARRPPAARVPVLRGDLSGDAPQVFVEGERRDDLLRRASSITTASRTRPRSRCSTACRTARIPCTSRAREA